MPRPPRIQFPGAIYHVISRGDAKSHSRSCTDAFAELGFGHAARAVRLRKLVCQTQPKNRSHISRSLQSSARRGWRLLLDTFAVHSLELRQRHASVGRSPGKLAPEFLSRILPKIQSFPGLPTMITMRTSRGKTAERTRPRPIASMSRKASIASKIHSRPTFASGSSAAQTS